MKWNCKIFNEKEQVLKFINEKELMPDEFKISEVEYVLARHSSFQTVYSKDIRYKITVWYYEKEV